MLAPEATWCACCKSGFHRDCLAKAEEICPKCERRYDPPERHFVLSKFCPECIQVNEPPLARCSACGANTLWDTRADYEAFVAHMKHTARVRLVWGLAQIGAGAICLLALVTARAFLTYFLIAFMLSTSAGMLTLLSSKRIAQFR